MEKLRLGTMTPTTLSIQMVDRSLKYLKFIIKDVFVKVEKFIFHVNFDVLDIEEHMEVPINWLDHF